MEIPAPAFRAFRRPARTEGCAPTMTTIGTHKKLLPHCDDASFDFQSLGIHNRIRDFFPRRFDDIAEGLSRNVHAFGRFLLV
jgi:hypothetical protein